MKFRNEMLSFRFCLSNVRNGLLKFALLGEKHSLGLSTALEHDFRGNKVSDVSEYLHVSWSVEVEV